MKRTNQAKETHDAPKDFYYENLDKQVGVGRVCERSGGAGDANGYAAEEIACADCETAPEESVAWYVMWGQFSSQCKKENLGLVTGEVVFACVEEVFGHGDEPCGVDYADDLCAEGVLRCYVGGESGTGSVRLRRWRRLRKR